MAVSPRATSVTYTQSPPDDTLTTALSPRSATPSNCSGTLRVSRAPVSYSHGPNTVPRRTTVRLSVSVAVGVR